MSEGLNAISTEALTRLLYAIEQGHLELPLTKAGLTSQGLHDLAGKLGLLELLDEVAAATVLQAVLAERNAPKAKLSLVWTGPEHAASETRDTRIVVRELFERAKSQVLIGGYAFDHGEEIFAPLHAGMRDHQVRAEVFLDLREQAALENTVREHATRVIDRFLAHNWPFGAPRPDIYYDPRSAAKGTYASLHAKCVVVDGRLTLVTSANFTDRGQTRNLEAGVLIDDATFAGLMLRQWRGLVDAGLVQRYAG